MAGKFNLLFFSLLGGNRFQEAQFTFVLSPTQATNIASNRDIQIGARLDFLYQVSLFSTFLTLSKVHFTFKKLF